MDDLIDNLSQFLNFLEKLRSSQILKAFLFVFDAFSLYKSQFYDQDRFRPSQRNLYLVFPDIKSPLYFFKICQKISLKISMKPL